ncbi:MAG: radical SAM protein [Desulfobacteraceae bacterium]|nr:radical SAM protein [Desulfobacteraceae bacterium]
MRYEGTIIRPFSEADSYLLQCTLGCSHNQCTFCGTYKDKPFRVRPLADIKTDIQMAKEHLGDARKVFLCDGDAIALSTEMLLEILKELYTAFASLRHVGTYVGPKSTLGKSMAELKSLRAAGLSKVYLGVETGDDRLLKEVNKGVSAQQMLQAGRNLVGADFNLSAMVLLGLAGRGQRSHDHAVATAEMINAMQPRYLAAMTVIPVAGTPLYQQVRAGQFELLDPFETLVEMRTLFDHITMDKLKFVGVHASNYLPINGTLQQDKARMLAMVDEVLKRQDASHLRSERQRGL